MTVDPLAPWMIVPITILKQLPYGLLVQLKGGRRGIIRIREVSWERQDRSRPQELCPVGMSTEAMIIKIEPDGPIELSLRLAEHDPWEKMLSIYKTGQEIQGVVTGVKSYGAFVEIEQGLTGLLHHSRLPVWVKKRDPLMLFWPGDLVRAKISQIDTEMRRIDLSMDGILRDLSTNTAGNIIPLETTLPRYQQTDPLAQHTLARQPSRLILHVEDDVEQVKLMHSWLTKMGQRVLSAESAEEGLILAQKEHPDLVIVDFGLPGIDGIQMIRRLTQGKLLMTCILATDWARIHEHISDVEILQRTGVEVMIKPIMPEDLVDVLLRMHAAQNKKEETKLTSANENLQLLELDANTDRKAMISALEKCCWATHFNYAMLVSLDPGTRKIEVVVKTHNAALKLSAIDDLVHSPVRDVAEDGMTISEENLRSEIPGGRLHYLQTFCRFSACLGIHVPVASHHKYALFLFSGSARPIRPDHLNFAHATAIALGSTLEKRTFQERARALHKVALLGQMASSLVHEINHSLSLLDPGLEILAGILEQMIHKIRSGSELTTTDVLQASTSLQEARQTLGMLYSMTRLISVPFGQKREEYIRIDELVEMTILLLRDLSKRHRVPINLVKPQKLIFLRTHGSLLLQVLWNILLNAVEQISEFRPHEGGAIQVRIETSNSANKHPMLKILVEDNGPGIHCQLWDRIFEAGFSTREEGSGLGLYISQGIIKSLGGTLSVRESLILGGTTFVIEVPHQM